MYPDLPKVGYVHMLQSQGLLHDTYYYGVDAKQMVPTFMYPTEIMDGAIVSGNCVAPCDKVTTFHHFHNPVIEDCTSITVRTLTSWELSLLMKTYSLQIRKDIRIWLPNWRSIWDLTEL